MFSKANAVESLKHYLVGAAVYGLGLSVYLTHDYYAGFLRPETRSLLIALYALFLLLAFPCYFLKQDKQLHHNRLFIAVSAFTRVMRGMLRYASRSADGLVRPLPRLSHEEKTALLFLLVKLFFIPLMLNFAIDNALVLLHYYHQFPFSLPPMELALSILYPLALAVIFFIDTLWFSFGYLVEARFLNNTVRSVEPTLLGWGVALASYPPFNVMLVSYVGWAPSDHVYFFSDAWTLVARIAIVLMLLVYLWATLSLGAKCSNLTNRGIVSRGAYRFVRHPAYVAKNLSWWIMLIPVMSAGVAASMAVWSFIYYLRAITEERHLIRDPDYQAYVKKVKWRFVPGVY